MTSTRAAAILINAGEFGIGKICTEKHDKPYQDLVSNDMAEEEVRFPFGSYYLATEATPLALLTPTQFLCAQQLAESGEIGFNSVPKAQRTHMDKLIKNGWAGWHSLYVGRVWVPTPKLIEAIECWYESRESRS